MPNMQPSEFLSITEASEIIGVSPKTLRRWEEEGKIAPARTLGNQRRYHRDHVQKVKENTSKQHSPYLSIAKTASYLGVSQKTLSRWEREGHLHKIKINSSQRGYPRSEVENIVRRHGKTTKRGSSERFAFSEGFNDGTTPVHSTHHFHYQGTNQIQDLNSLSNPAILNNPSETTNHSLKSTGKQNNRRTGKLIKVLCIVFIVLALSPVITQALNSHTKQLFVGLLEPVIIDIYRRHGFDKPLTNILIPGTLTNSSTEPEALLHDLGLPTPTTLPDSSTLPNK